jgi:hypothetical protein
MLERVNRCFDRSDVIVDLDDIEDYAADTSDKLKDRDRLVAESLIATCVQLAIIDGNKRTELGTHA